MASLAVSEACVGVAGGGFCVLWAVLEAFPVAVWLLRPSWRRARGWPAVVFGCFACVGSVPGGEGTWISSKKTCPEVRGEAKIHFLGGGCGKVRVILIG